ncbi:MAG: PQQ-dependent sugar dehydrogenase [Acidovorax sp.]
MPIAGPDTRPDLAKPVIYWTPVIAPGNLMFYSGAMFPKWKGSAFVTGLVSRALHRIEVHGAIAIPAEHWTLGFRVRDVAQAPDGGLWLIEDDYEGGLYRLTPK